MGSTTDLAHTTFSWHNINCIGMHCEFNICDSYSVELSVPPETPLDVAGLSNCSARKNAPEKPIRNTMKMARNLVRSLFKMMNSV